MINCIFIASEVDEIITFLIVDAKTNGMGGGILDKFIIIK